MVVREAMIGLYPCLIARSGVPLVVLAGLSPDAGVGRGPMRRTHEQALRPSTSGRRVFCLNRRVGLPLGLTMPMLPAEHAEAMRAEFGEPVDVLGLSTGGSIAQQLAADHPDVVRRLVLISTGCRLGPAARMAQRRVAAPSCWRGPPSASGDGGRVRSALARPVHRRGRGLGAGDALVPRRRSVRHGDHERGRGHFDLADYPTIASSTLLLADGRDRFYDLAILGETAGSVRRRVCRGCLPRSGHGFGATLSEPAVAANGAARRPGRRLLRRVGRRC